MLAMLRRLFGGTRSRAAATPRRRSVTGDVLTRARQTAPTETRGQRDAPTAGTGDDFDPYNTGKFDRAASWERVRHSHR